MSDADRPTDEPTETDGDPAEPAKTDGETGTDGDAGTGEPTEPVIVRAGEGTDEPVAAADGLTKRVLLDESNGAPNFALRRFELAPGASVPRHTNAVEHEQYVLQGEYTVGIGDREHEVSPGDALLIPAGTVHWYHNAGDDPAAFLCAVPNGDDTIELVE